MSAILGVGTLLLGWEGIGNGFNNICPFEIKNFFGPGHHLRTPMAHCYFAYTVITIISLGGFIYTGLKGDLLSKIKALVYWQRPPALWIFILFPFYLGTASLFALFGQVSVSGVPPGISDEVFCLFWMVFFYAWAMTCAFGFKNVSIALFSASVIMACFALMNGYVIFSLDHISVTPVETPVEEMPDVDFYMRFQGGELPQKCQEVLLHFSLWFGLLAEIAGMGLCIFSAIKLKGRK